MVATAIFDELASRDFAISGEFRNRRCQHSAHPASKQANSTAPKIKLGSGVLRLSVPSFAWQPATNSVSWRGALSGLRVATSLIRK